MLRDERKRSRPSQQDLSDSEERQSPSCDRRRRGCRRDRFQHTSARGQHSAILVHRMITTSAPSGWAKAPRLEKVEESVYIESKPRSMTSKMDAKSTMRSWKASSAPLQDVRRRDATTILASTCCLANGCARDLLPPPGGRSGRRVIREDLAQGVVQRRDANPKHKFYETDNDNDNKQRDKFKCDPANPMWLQWRRRGATGSGSEV